MKKLTILCLVLSLASIVVAQGGGDDPNAVDPGPWPQFRGPEGMGISDATNLPVEWSENSENIRWKTPLPGYGVSSPVISGGRVFVTTSFESRKAAQLTSFIKNAGLILCVLALIGWALRWIQSQRRLKKGQPSLWPQGKVAWADEILILLLVLFFLTLAFATTVTPAGYDRTLDTVGRWIAGKYPDLEKLVTIDPGVYAGVWLTAGAMALVGLAAVAATVRGIVWRLLAIGILSWGAWKLYQETPLDEWYEKIEVVEKLLFVLPALFLGGLAFLDSFEARTVYSPLEKGDTSTRTQGALEIRLRNRYIWHTGEIGTTLTVLCLLLLCALVFIPGNYYLAKQGMDRAVLCVDLESGELLWEKVVWTDEAERKHSDNSYATPTCATDGQRVVAFFGGVLTCLDYKGEVLWQHRDEQYINNVKYGSSSSPVIVGDRVIVLQGKEDKSKRPTWLAAFDMVTGDVLWRIQPPDIGEGYTTPVVHQGPENTQILIPSQHLLNAYDMANGKRLWSMTSPIDQIVASPVKKGNTLILAGGTWGPKAVIALKLSDHPRQAPRTLWQTENGAAGCSSPVIVDDRLYTLSDRGMLTCLGLERGQLKWIQGIKGRHLASLVFGEGKIYAHSTKGHTTVLDLGPEHKILSRNHLPGKSHATPALAPGCIVLRVGDALYCVNGG